MGFGKHRCRCSGKRVSHLLRRADTSELEDCNGILGMVIGNVNDFVLEGKIEETTVNSCKKRDNLFLLQRDCFESITV